MPFKILGSFTKLLVLSLAIGIIVGAFSSFVYKKVRLLTHQTIMECTIVFCFGYLSYCFAELLHASGIISLLTCGILMGHYTWHNLSPQAKHVTSVSFQVIGYAVEAFVFGYLGLTYFAYESFDWSKELIIIELVVVCVGRFVATISLIKFLE